MLGLVSGKSLIEEGGLLVGICQSSKAFLVLAGISLGLWILIFISSCAAMVTGLDPPKKGSSTHGSHRSLKSVLTSISRQKSSVRPPPLSASYIEEGNVHRDLQQQQQPHHRRTLAAPQVCHTTQKRSSHIDTIGVRAAGPVGSDRYYDNQEHHVEDIRQIPNYANNATSHNPHRCSSKCMIYSERRGDTQARKPMPTTTAVNPTTIKSPHPDRSRQSRGKRLDDVKAATMANLAGSFAPEKHSARFVPRNPEVNAGQQTKARYCCPQHLQQIDDDDASYKEASVPEHVARSIHSNASHGPTGPFNHDHLDHSGGEEYHEEHVSQNADHHNFEHTDEGEGQMSPTSQSSRRQRLLQLLSRTTE
ncbi:hypothetical protein GGI13_001571 [Coemansia sp. RSA 455]|nr:hypothetical protein GGI13_001571 [Coemansia sp. RSA 455]